MQINIIEIASLISILFIITTLIYQYNKYRNLACTQEINNLYKTTEEIADLTLTLLKEAHLRTESIDNSYSQRRKKGFSELFATLKISELKTKGIGKSIIENLKIHGYDKISKLPQSNLTNLPSIGSHRAMLISHRIDYLKRKTNDRLLDNKNYNLKNKYDLDLIYNTINFIDINHSWQNNSKIIHRKNTSFQKELKSVTRFNFVKFIFSNHNKFISTNISFIEKIIANNEWNSIIKSNDLQRIDLLSRTTNNEYNEIQKVFSERKIEIIDALNKRFNPQSQHGSIAEKIAKKIEQTKFHPILKKGVNLRPYQVFGAKFVLQSKRTLLGDEMGLGKTLQALSIATHIQSVNGKVFALAIIPASLSENWKREVEKFTHLPVYILKGANIPQEVRRFTENGGIAIISYEATWQRLVNTYDFNLKLDLLIIDEAHYIKNELTNRALACTDFISISEHVLLMTGTPIENNISEMVNIIKHINKDVFGNILPNSIEKLTPSDFSKIVSSVYLRRKTDDVLQELPEKTITEEWIELSESDETAYISSVMNKSYHDMRRAVTVGDNSLSVPSAKIKRAKELVSEYLTLNRKIIIFTYYLDVIEYLKNIFATSFVLSGKIPINKRQQIIDDFSSSNEEHILVAQITSTGIGLNIQAASVVLIIEPQFKPSTEDQAIARSYRMGQKNHVNVHRFFTNNTLEERIYEILCQKSDQMKLYSNESRLKDVSKQATQFENDEVTFAKLITEEEYKKYSKTHT